MSAFKIDTTNRHAARKLLGKCGIDGARARVMPNRELQEHLENFVKLGTLTESEVVAALSAKSTDAQPANAGKPWTAEQDAALMYAFAMMSHGEYIAPNFLAELASSFGRTETGIGARLERNNLARYDERSRQYVIDFAALSAYRDKTGIALDHATRSYVQRSSNSGDAFETVPDEVPTRANHTYDNSTSEPTKETPTMSPVPAVPAVPAASTDAADVQSAVASALGAALGPIFAQLAASNKPAIDVDQIRALIAEEVPKHVGAYQRFAVTQSDGAEFKFEGLAHYATSRLMRAVMARTRHDGGALNIWLYGPAGTGKSTAARKLAEALNRGFETNGPVGSQWDIRGFRDAQGNIVDTAFRRAWIEGKVYCWDEGDGSAPSALIEANGALATGYASFPDGVFPRHKDCIIIINGNLRPGAAPDATYNGRYKQDTAFVNRFIAIEWGIDEDLERALLGNLSGTAQQWYALVRKIRARVKERGIKGVVISPRQAQYGLALIDAGADLAETTDMVIRFMFTDEQWDQVAA